MEYIPRTNPKGKWETELCSRNGGIHNQTKFKEAVRMLERATAEWRRPLLCHICFTSADKKTYLAIVKRLCRELKAEGVKCDYKGAIEQENGLKGLHYHLMLVIEHRDDGPKPFRLISNSPKSLLRRAVDHFKDTSSVQYRINPSTYSGGRFLPISKTNYEIFNEAVEWISYIYKVRTKNHVDGTVYYSSRDRQPKKPRTLH